MGWLRIFDRRVDLGWSASIVLAAICVGVATVARVVLGEIFSTNLTFATYFPAVLVVALFGGMVAGLLSIGLSIIVIWWAIMAPVYEFAPLTNTQISNLVVFALSTLLTVLLAAKYRAQLAALERAERERNEVAQARDLSEHQLQLALAAGRLGHWSIDLATGDVVASDICKQCFGRGPADTFTAKDLRDSIFPEDKSRVKAAIKHTIATGVDYDIEYRVLKPDRTLGWVMVRGQLVRDSDGKPSGLSGVSLDIGPRKFAEIALAESEARFKTFAQAMPNQVWSSTPDGRLDWFNEQVYAYSGLSFGDLEGTGWAQMVHPDDLDAAAQLWAQSLAKGSQYQTQFRLRRSDGSWRWHLARALPIRDQSGSITRWIGTNTDIDDQKVAEAQQQLLAHELEHRMKNTMAMVGAIATQTFRRRCNA